MKSNPAVVYTEGDCAVISRMNIRRLEEGWYGILVVDVGTIDKHKQSFFTSL